MSNNNYEDEDSSQDSLRTAYSLAKQIKKNIDSINLEETYTSVTVDLDLEAGTTEVNYRIEATDIYNELDDVPEPSTLQKSARIEPLDDNFPADEEIVTEALEENLESALKVNGQVVKELISPDYNAF